jgi:hypothetical protein
LTLRPAISETRAPVSRNYNRNEAGTYRQTMTGDGSRYELIWVVRIE